MRFKSFPLGKFREKLANDSNEADDAVADKIASLEEQVNDKTRELEETKQRLEALSTTVQVSGEESLPKPHGPLGELTVESGDELGADEIDADTLFEEAGEEIPVVEVIKAEAVKPEAEKGSPEATAAAEKEAPEATAAAEKESPEATIEVEKEKKEKEAPAGGDESLASLFSDDEEEEKPLAALINALPDVTPQELLDDLQEIKGIIKELQR